jgi:hypothetical protein
MAIYVEGKVCLYEGLGTVVDQVEGLGDHGWDRDEARDVVDRLESLVQIHFEEFGAQLSEDRYCDEEEELYFLSEQVCP